MPLYFADVGPEKGPFPDRDAIGSIGVLGSRIDLMTIGMAVPVATDGAGRILWRLLVRGELLPGRWVLIAREFRQVAE